MDSSIRIYLEWKYKQRDGLTRKQAQHRKVNALATGHIEFHITRSTVLNWFQHMVASYDGYKHLYLSHVAPVSMHHLGQSFLHSQVKIEELGATQDPAGDAPMRMMVRETEIPRFRPPRWVKVLRPALKILYLLGMIARMYVDGWLKH